MTKVKDGGRGKEPRDCRVPIMFSERELQEIDDWRFENRVGTRAGAIRLLSAAAVLAAREPKP